MAQNQNQGGGGRHFYMVRPVAGAGNAPMIEAVAGKVGEYNVTVLIGQSTTNPNARNQNPILLVGFVNGKQLPGTIKILGEKYETFHSVKPDKSGDIEIAVSSVGTPDPDAGVKIMFDRKELSAIAPVVPPKVERIKISKSPKGADGFYTMNIQIFDDKGTQATGKVQVSARQNFIIGSKKSSGYAEIDITQVTGVTIRIKAADWNESFLFADLASGDSHNVQLLKG